MPYSKVALMRKHTVRLLLEGRYGLSSLLRQTTVLRSKREHNCPRMCSYAEIFASVAVYKAL